MSWRLQPSSMHVNSRWCCGLRRRRWRRYYGGNPNTETEELPSNGDKRPPRMAVTATVRTRRRAAQAGEHELVPPLTRILVSDMSGSVKLFTAKHEKYNIPHVRPCQREMPTQACWRRQRPSRMLLTIVQNCSGNAPCAHEIWISQLSDSYVYLLRPGPLCVCLLRLPPGSD